MKSSFVLSGQTLVYATVRKRGICAGNFRTGIEEKGGLEHRGVGVCVYYCVCCDGLVFWVLRIMRHIDWVTVLLMNRWGNVCNYMVPL